MINVETPGFSFVLGDGTWQDQVQRDELLATMAIDEYALSDDEATTSYVILHPREARVAGSLPEQLLRTAPTIESGMRLALIRWLDDTESLVSFPAGNTSPEPELLMSAYRNGFAVSRILVGETAFLAWGRKSGGSHA